MILTTIEDLKPAKGKEGVWLFAVRLALPEGETWKSLGWRYFEESREVVPPSTKIGKGWIKTTQVGERFLVSLAEQVRETLTPPDEARKFAEEVWTGYRNTRAEMELDEALTDLAALGEKNKHQWAVLMLLRVAANPERHLEGNLWD